MKVKIAVWLVASIYLGVYALFFSRFYSLASTNWIVYSKVFAVTVTVAIITVIVVPTEFFLRRLID